MTRRGAIRAGRATSLQQTHDPSGTLLLGHRAAGGHGGCLGPARGLVPFTGRVSPALPQGHLLVSPLRSGEATGFSGLSFAQFGVCSLESCIVPAPIRREDACDVLAGLRSVDFDSVVTSIGTGETLYVFKPEVASMRLYVKLLTRTHCVVISFHEDRPDDVEETKA